MPEYSKPAARTSPKRSILRKPTSMAELAKFPDAGEVDCAEGIPFGYNGNCIGAVGSSVRSFDHGGFGLEPPCQPYALTVVEGEYHALINHHPGQGGQSTWGNLT